MIRGGNKSQNNHDGFGIGSAPFDSICLKSRVAEETTSVAQNLQDALLLELEQATGALLSALAWG